MLKIYLIIFSGLLLISGAGLALAFLYLSPQDFPVLAPSVFFTFLFILTFSFFSITGYFIRRITMMKVNKLISFTLSFRQGLFLAIFSCISAYFIHLKVFTWWSELLVLTLLLLIEMFFMIREDSERDKTS